MFSERDILCMSHADNPKETMTQYEALLSRNDCCASVLGRSLTRLSDTIKHACYQTHHRAVMYGNFPDGLIFTKNKQIEHAQKSVMAIDGKRKYEIFLMPQKLSCLAACKLIYSEQVVVTEPMTLFNCAFVVRKLMFVQ